MKLTKYILSFVLVMMLVLALSPAALAADNTSCELSIKDEAGNEITTVSCDCEDLSDHSSCSFTLPAQDDYKDGYYYTFGSTKMYAGEELSCYDWMICWEHDHTDGPCATITLVGEKKPAVTYTACKLNIVDAEDNLIQTLTCDCEDLNDHFNCSFTLPALKDYKAGYYYTFGSSSFKAGEEVSCYDWMIDWDHEHTDGPCGTITLIGEKKVPTACMLSIKDEAGNEITTVTCGCDDLSDHANCTFTLPAQDGYKDGYYYTFGSTKMYAGEELSCYDWMIDWDHEHTDGPCATITLIGEKKAAYTYKVILKVDGKVWKTLEVESDETSYTFELEAPEAKKNSHFVQWYKLNIFGYNTYTQKITLTKNNSTVILNAKFESCSDVKPSDLVCDSCKASVSCQHKKDSRGYCTVSSCKHANIEGATCCVKRVETTVNYISLTKVIKTIISWLR